MKRVPVIKNIPYPVYKDVPYYEPVYKTVFKLVPDRYPVYAHVPVLKVRPQVHQVPVVSVVPEIRRLPFVTHRYHISAQPTYVPYRVPRRPHGHGQHGQHGHGQHGAVRGSRHQHQHQHQRYEDTADRQSYDSHQQGGYGGYQRHHQQGDYLNHDGDYADRDGDYVYDSHQAADEDRAAI